MMSHMGFFLPCFKFLKALIFRVLLDI